MKFKQITIINSETDAMEQVLLNIDSIVMIRPHSHVNLGRCVVTTVDGHEYVIDESYNTFGSKFLERSGQNKNDFHL